MCQTCFTLVYFWAQVSKPLCPDRCWCAHPPYSAWRVASKSYFTSWVVQVSFKWLPLKQLSHMFHCYNALTFYKTWRHLIVISSSQDFICFEHAPFPSLSYKQEWRDPISLTPPHKRFINPSFSPLHALQRLDINLLYKTPRTQLNHISSKGASWFCLAVWMLRDWEQQFG